jgi:ABC-2 type transport system permease protein
MFGRIKEIVVKEVLEMLRDPKMKIVIFIMPIFQVLIFGSAISTDVENVRTAVYDLDNTPASRELAREFFLSRYFHRCENISNDKEQSAAVDHSRVSAVIRIDKGFAASLAAGRKGEFQLIVDGTDSNTAGIVAAYAGRISARYSAGLASKAPEKDISKKTPRVDIRIRTWFNENLISRNFYVPGITALIVYIITMLLTAMAIVREKEVGTIEQLMVSPIRPIELILGKLIPFAGLGIIMSFFVIVFAKFVFQVPFRGSPTLLFGALVLFLVSSLGIGLFISTISKTQQEALMTTFFIAQPSVLLSGFVFPIESMPKAVQYLTLANPLRYYTEIVRGIFLKDSGIGVLWPNMAALAVIGVSIIAVSALKFKKNIG